MALPKTDTFDTKGPGSAAPGSPGLITIYAPEGGVPKAVLLTKDELVIGREAPCGLVLPFGSVSRAHARITKGEAEGEWVVHDLDSRNGTFVNGSKIHRAELADGDELRLGAVVLELVTQGAERYLDSVSEGPLPEAVAALVGGASMAPVRREILLVAGAELSVLVLGESGTGKELVARALHGASGRTGAFAALNCAAVPATLLEAELFGARRGAFTGLDRDRLGLIRSADRGTLFLDEIGDMPLEAQAKLLRVLDTREVTPLGSHLPEPVDVRIVSATHRPIHQLVQEQRFRADLFARISAHTIVLPPLRERKEDIPLLVQTFLGRQAKLKGRPLTATPQFVIGLLRYDWPLNVRELETAVSRAVVLAADSGVDEPHLPPVVLEAVRTARAEDQDRPPKVSARTTAPPEEELRALLRKCAGNVAAVARELGKDRAQIHRWLKLYQLSLDDFRP